MVSSMLLRVVVIRAESPTRCTSFSRTVFTTCLLYTSLACARGWAALSLYKMQEDDA